MESPPAPAESPPRSDRGRDELEDLIFAWLEAGEAEGPDPALERLCREHPTYATELRRRAGSLRAAGLVGGADADLPLPTRLGHFELAERIGGGGMGVVYRARDLELGRDVALKLVRPDQLHFPGMRERFGREVALAARLRHPGIVTVHSVGEAQGIPFFAMELVAGASLSDALQRLEGRPLRALSGADLARAAGAPDDSSSAIFRAGWVECGVRVAHAAALALAHAHEHGVVHRDVKPSNLMLSRQGEVLLTDFGLASSEGTVRITRSGSQPGSLPYMAPETLRGAAADARADVYGLGATLYELLSLRLAYHSGDAEDLRRRIAEGSAVPLRRLNPAVPLDVETVCHKALEVDPRRRYASAADFARDLERILAHRPVEARAAGPWLRAWRWAQRNPAWSGAAAVAAVALVLGPLAWALVEARRAQTLRELNADLSAALEDARAANERARGEQRHAESNFAQALAAVDRLLTRVGEDMLVGVPQMEQVQRAVLEDALDFYRALAEERRGDPALQVELAGAETRVGTIQRYLGDFAAAEASLARAEAILRSRLPPGEAGTPDAERLTLAEVLAKRGMALRQIGRTEEARAALVEASAIAAELSALPALAARARDVEIDAQEQLGRAERLLGQRENAAQAHARAAELARAASDAAPDDAELALRAARALEALASARLLDLGDRKGAGTVFDEALERLEPVREHPATARGAKSVLAGVAVNYGMLLVESGEIERAEALYREALEAIDALHRDFPSVLEHASMAANLRMNLAAAFGPTPARHPEAFELLDQAVALHEGVVAAQPASAEYRTRLANALSAIGFFRVRSGEPARAVEVLERAVAEQRQAISAAPQYPSYRRRLVENLFRLCDAHLEAGDSAAGSAAVREALPDCGEDWVQLRRAAGRLARASAVAQADAALPEAEREPSAAALRTEALELLHKAFEHGYRDLEDLMGDSDFEALRGTAEVERLAAAIRAAIG